jgi:hypothetical protein
VAESLRRPALRLIAALALAAAALAAFAPSSTVRVWAAPSSCAIDGVERIVAVGDAHGAYDEYVGILTTAGIIDNRQRWAAGKTHFVQTGDMVDRGPDSRKIMDLAQKLQRDAPSKGGAAHILLGNHEIARMIGDLRYVSAAEYQAFATNDSEDLRDRYIEMIKAPDPDALRKVMPLGSIEMQLAFGPKGDYGKWLRTLDTVVKINGILFMHGGISPAIAPMACDDINATVRTELTTDLEKTMQAPLQSLSGREDGPLWYRGLAQEPDDFAPTVAEILAQQNARAIVVGHTIVNTGRIRSRFGGTVFQIDTGMLRSYVPNGHASALEIRNGTFTAIYRDGRQPLDAATPPK